MFTEFYVRFEIRIFLNQLVIFSFVKKNKSLKFIIKQGKHYIVPIYFLFS